MTDGLMLIFLLGYLVGTVATKFWCSVTMASMTTLEIEKERAREEGYRAGSATGAERAISAIAAGLLPVKVPGWSRPIPSSMLKRLLRLCHPDRHEGSEDAHEAMVWLLDRRREHLGGPHA